MENQGNSIQTYPTWYAWVPDGKMRYIASWLC